MSYSKAEGYQAVYDNEIMTKNHSLASFFDKVLVLAQPRFRVIRS